MGRAHQRLCAGSRAGAAGREPRRVARGAPRPRPRGAGRRVVRQLAPAHTGADVLEHRGRRHAVQPGAAVAFDTAVGAARAAGPGAGCVRARGRRAGRAPAWAAHSPRLARCALPAPHARHRRRRTLPDGRVRRLPAACRSPAAAAQRCCWAGPPACPATCSSSPRSPRRCQTAATCPGYSCQAFWRTSRRRRSARRPWRERAARAARHAGAAPDRCARAGCWA